MTSAEFLQYQMKTARQHNAGMVGEVECHSEGDQEIKRSAAQRETALHCQIISFCDARFPRWKFVHARTDQPSTIAVGCHDFTIFAPGRMLCIECKRPGGKLRPEQLQWQTEMRMLGYTVHVVETFEQFLNLTNKPPLVESP